jgi:hypothetical protein
VDHDVKTSGDTALCRASVIVIRWIGNVQRKMIAALRIPAVDLVDSFRRFHVALLFLRPDRAAAQCNAISLELPAVAKDRQFPGRFFDEDPIDRRSRAQGMPIVACVEVNSQRQRTDDGRRQSDLANHIGRFDDLAKNANKQTRRVARQLAGRANHGIPAGSNLPPPFVIANARCMPHRCAARL